MKTVIAATPWKTTCSVIPVMSRGWRKAPCPPPFTSTTFSQSLSRCHRNEKLRLHSRNLPIHSSGLEKEMGGRRLARGLFPTTTEVKPTVLYVYFPSAFLHCHSFIRLLRKTSSKCMARDRRLHQGHRVNSALFWEQFPFRRETFALMDFTMSSEAQSAADIFNPLPPLGKYLHPNTLPRTSFSVLLLP